MRDCALILKHIGELIMPTKKTVKKTKNVLIISASFRPNSNSHALCLEVANTAPDSVSRSRPIFT